MIVAYWSGSVAALIALVLVGIGPPKVVSVVIQPISIEVRGVGAGMGRRTIECPTDNPVDTNILNATIDAKS